MTLEEAQNVSYVSAGLCAPDRLWRPPLCSEARQAALVASRMGEGPGEGSPRPAARPATAAS
jgi:hypothetical protein